MPRGNDKFLVDLVHGISPKQAFFLVWAGIVGIFVAMMYAHYRRTTRRNFKGPGDDSVPPARVDARRLADGAADKRMTVRKNENR